MRTGYDTRFSYHCNCENAWRGAVKQPRHRCQAEAKKIAHLCTRFRAGRKAFYPIVLAGFSLRAGVTESAKVSRSLNSAALTEGSASTTSLPDKRLASWRDRRQGQILTRVSEGGGSTALRPGAFRDRLLYPNSRGTAPAPPRGSGRPTIGQKTRAHRHARGFLLSTAASSGRHSTGGPNISSVRRTCSPLVSIRQ